MGAERGATERGEGETPSEGLDLFRGRRRLSDGVVEVDEGEEEDEGDEREDGSECCWASLVRAAIFSRSCCTADNPPCAGTCAGGGELSACTGDDEDEDEETFCVVEVVVVTEGAGVGGACACCAAFVRAAIFFLSSSNALVAPPLVVSVSTGDELGEDEEVGEGRGNGLAPLAEAVGEARVVEAGGI